MFGFLLNLMRLSFGKLTIRTIVSLITPNTNAWRKHWISSRKNPWIVRLPPTRMNYNFISYFYIGNIFTNSPNNSRSVRTTSMKILRFSFFLAVFNNIYRKAKSCPDVVIIHTRSHYINQDILRTYFRSIDYLPLPCVYRISKPVLPN